MSRKNLIIYFIIILVVVIGIFLFSKSNQPTNIKESAVKSFKNNHPSSVKEFIIIAKNWAFEPSEIKVKQGDVVRLKIKSVDVAHGFGLPDFNIDRRLEPGKETLVEFTANKKGTFTFFCSVYCGEGHKDMKGVLVVE